MKNNLSNYKERMLIDSEPLGMEHKTEAGDLVLVSDDGSYWSIARFNALLTREVPDEPPSRTYEVKPLDDEYTLIYKMCRHVRLYRLPQILVKDSCGDAIVTRIVGVTDKDTVVTTFGKYPAKSIAYVDDVKFGGDDA